MFRSNNRRESSIPVDLEEPLTGNSCSQLVMEILKYTMYQKQQIPFSCDTLMRLHANSKSSDRNFSSMQTLLNRLSNVSNNLSSQFKIDGCDIKEILIVIGATVVSPKLCIRVELPRNVLSSNDHLEYQHCYRKPLLSVMRSILESSEFQDELTVPLGLTNTFVLIQKRDPHKISEYFVPKPQFVFSQNTPFFNIRLNYNENNELSCNCKNVVKVYHDSCDEHYSDKNIAREKSNNRESEIPYLWYQSKEVFKGFKFVR